jgi:hypothetical protein
MLHCLQKWHDSPRFNMINQAMPRGVLMEAVRQFCMESQLEQGQGKIHYVAPSEPATLPPEVTSFSERKPAVMAPAGSREVEERSPDRHKSREREKDGGQQKSPADNKDRSRSVTFQG